MRGWSFGVLGVLGVTAAACGAASGGGATARLRPACPAEHLWDGSRCAPAAAGQRGLEAGTRAMAQGEVEAALAQFQTALRAGPHPYERHLQIVEKVGIAESYLGREAEALRAFDLLLSLDPGHVLSYGLSPQATQPFEKARRASRARPAPEVQVSWPYDLEVSRPVPIDVAVVADPKRFLARATLFARRRGEVRFSAVDLALAPRGRHTSIRLPALASGRPEVVQVYLTAFDRRGNEVLRWAGPDQPRAIALGWDPPTPWYRTWWVWAGVGAAAAIGTGIAVFVATDDPPDLIDDGSFSF